MPVNVNIQSCTRSHNTVPITFCRSFSLSLFFTINTHAAVCMPACRTGYRIENIIRHARIDALLYALCMFSIRCIHIQWRSTRKQSFKVQFLDTDSRQLNNFSCFLKNGKCFTLHSSEIWSCPSEYQHQKVENHTSEKNYCLQCIRMHAWTKGCNTISIAS